MATATLPVPMAPPPSCPTATVGTLPIPSGYADTAANRYTRATSSWSPGPEQPPPKSLAFMMLRPSPPSAQASSYARKARTCQPEMLARSLLAIRPEQKCATAAGRLLERTTRSAGRLAFATGRRCASVEFASAMVSGAVSTRAGAKPVRSPEEGAMSAHQLLDAAGRPRSPATMPGHHVGRVPANKGRRYPADPPTVDEIVAVMRHAGDDRHGRRMRGLIVVLWRAGLRIHEALTLAETELNERRGSLLIRHGKGAGVASSGWTPGHGRAWPTGRRSGRRSRPGRCSA